MEIVVIIAAALVFIWAISNTIKFDLQYRIKAKDKDQDVETGSWPFPTGTAAEIVKEVKPAKPTKRKTKSR